MSDEETLDRRLQAVERTLTDGNHDVTALRDAAALTDRVETLEAELDDARDRIVELEAATQALRGYVGNVRSVNEDVERRADAALATVERLEERMDDDGRAAHKRTPSARTTPDDPTGGASQSNSRTGLSPDGNGPERGFDDGIGREDGGREHDDESGAGLVQRVRDAL